MKSKKDICKEYILAHVDLEAKESALSNSFSLLSRDNGFAVFVLPDLYRELVEGMFLQLVGESNVDWVHYWLYERPTAKEVVIVVNGKDHKVSTFDELWSLVGTE